MNYDRIYELLRALERERVRYVLVGGVAVNLHGLVRATEDIDLFVEPQEENVRRLKAALKSVWQDSAIDQISAADLMGDYPTIRYGTPDPDIVVDILARLGTEWTFDKLESETINVRGTNVVIATPNTLYNMKKNTLRAHDKGDAYRLMEKFNLKG